MSLNLRGPSAGTFVARDTSAQTDQRLGYGNAPTFSASFAFSKIAPNQDGYLTWKNLTIHAGSASVAEAGGAPSYFKAVGGSIVHDGPGNLDVFWSSVQHSGTREVGLFIGDITGTAGGNLYGAHMVLAPSTVSPAVLEGVMAELVPSVARGGGEWYGLHARNSGTTQASAGLQIDGKNGGTFLYGINIDKSAGTGAAGAALRLGGGSNWANMIQAFASDGATQIFRVTSSGRVDATTGGVTSKYNTTAPSFVTNGHVEVYFDGTTNWLVAHSNGATKKVALS